MTAVRPSRKALAPWALATAVLAGQAMAALDTSIVNVGGPSIQRDLHLSGALLQLAVYSYVLVYAVVLISGARLGGRYGYGRLFGYGVAIFTAASLACALAVTPAMLVGARAVQGLGAALLVPQVLSLLQTTFEGESRRRALNLYGMVLAVGVGAGQVLGGILVNADLFGAGWRPIFLVNLPVGAAILACSTGRLPNPPGAPSRLDLAGAALLGLGVLALVTPLTFGAGAGWPAWCWPALALGGAALLVFGRHEVRLAGAGREPLVAPALLAPREVRAGLAGIFALMGCFGALLFSTAVQLQRALHESALRSGLTFAGFSAGFATAALGWSRLPASLRRRLPAVAFAAMAASTGCLAWATAGDRWPWQASTVLAIAGLCNGAGFGALVQRTAGSVPRAHAAALSGVLATTNQLAIVTGIAAGGTLYLAAGFPYVLLAIAAVQALAGAAVALPLTTGTG
jgi:MFS family permease